MLRDTPPNLEHESELFKQGFDYVVGMDEVGRGCLAGPVVVGATILPKEFKGFVCDVPINDSKKLTNNKRRRVNEAITDQAVTATGHATASEIDTYGITWATHTAALRALEELEGICAESTFVLTDNRLLSKELGFPFAYDSILKGDSSSIAI
ncbi:hypothetical protein KC614_01600, partial [candidate division WWE3 bacterium]|nr:hypothetical protein [candidate division WWE3 bacterium]